MWANEAASLARIILSVVTGLAMHFSCPINHLKNGRRENPNHSHYKPKI
jgi:hypothetical protein